MASSISLLKPGLKTAVVEGLYNEIQTNTNNYYYFLGRTLEWSGAADAASAPQASLEYEAQTRERMIFLKKITSADTAFTIPRYNWTSGTVFDKYDDAVGKYTLVSGCEGNIGTTYLIYPAELDISTIAVGNLVTGTNIAVGATVTSIDTVNQRVNLSLPNLGVYSDATVTFTTIAASGALTLDAAQFYCITSDNSVYKCIDNNGGAASTIKPYGTSHQKITTSDGYVWKYMYTIPNALINKFSTINDIPVTTALKNQYYSQGSINSVSIVNNGTGYQPGDALVVTGDGNLRDNVYKVLGLSVDVPGYGYNTAPTLSITDPYDAVDFIGEELYLIGQYVKAGTNIYQVTASGVAGTIAPTHTSVEPIYNGTAAFKFIGLAINATPNLVSTSIDTVSLTGIIGYVNVLSTGSGYDANLPPVVTIVGDGTNATGIASIVGGRVVGITVTDKGADYSTASVTIDPPVSLATATAAVSGGIIIGTTIDYQGTGYNGATPPGVTVIGGNGDAVINAVVVNGRVVNLIVADPGTGYTTAEIVIDPPPATATASPTIVGDAVDHIDIDTGGVGYDADNPPGVYISGDGANAFASVVIVDGVITEINVINNGTGYTYATVSIDPPGTQASAQAEIYYGYGYSTTPVVSVPAPMDSNYTWTAALAVNTGDIIEHATCFYQVTSSGGNLGDFPPIHLSGSASNGDVTLEFVGQTAVVTAIIQKTQAKLIPIIENGQITNVVVIDGGVGYTTATITAYGNADGDIDAEIIANLSIGDLNTNQTNVELLATPGTIDTIEVTHPGSGYSWAVVDIVGDGVGATATANITNGAITSITVTNAGTGYSKAVVRIIGNITANQAYARAIVSPIGGHGKNAVRELFAKDITLSTTIAKDRNQGFVVDNDYRQLGIIKNPFNFEATQRFTGFSGSVCYVVTGDFPYDSIENDTILFDANSNTVNTVVVHSGGENYINPTVTFSDPSDPTGTTATGTANVTDGVITSITLINRGSGYATAPNIIVDDAAGSGFDGTAVINLDNRFLVVAKPATNPNTDTLSLLVQPLDNTSVVAGQKLYIGSVTPGSECTVTLVTPPTVNKYSGDLLYIDNRSAFIPSDEQTVSIKTAIRL